MKPKVGNELDMLQSKVAEMCAKIEIALCRAVDAIKRMSKEEAEEVIACDGQVDEICSAIRTEGVRLVSAYRVNDQELKRIMAFVRVSGQLEHVGNLAVKMAERVVDAVDHKWQGNVESLDFSILSQHAYDMIHGALDALIYYDMDCARRVIETDDAVDAHHRGHFETFLQFILEHPKQGQFYLSGLMVSSCLERIADVATEIAKDVLASRNQSL